MVSFQKVFWSKIAVAGHGTIKDTFLDWLFSVLYRSSRYCFPSGCSPKVLKKNSDLDHSLPINCLSSANQQCVQLVSVTVFFKFSKLSVNPSWVKWCIFKTSQRSHSLERAQEVKLFPQWSGEGQISVVSTSSDICNFYTCATGCQKFSDIR